MEISRIIEAMIFVADTPLKAPQIIEVFDHEDFVEMAVTLESVEEALSFLLEKYKAEQFPFELKKIDGGYQFFTKTEFYPWLRQAALLRNQKKLSRSALETVAIIAYRQPITRPEIEFIRGVNCDYALQKLLDRKLIDISGRSDAPGRPLLYNTSDFFMEYFGINEIADLPKLQEFDINESEFQQQFKVYLEDKDDLEGLIEEGRITNKQNHLDQEGQGEEE